MRKQENYRTSARNRRYGRVRRADRTLRRICAALGYIGLSLGVVWGAVAVLGAALPSSLFALALVLMVVGAVGGIE